MAAVLAVWHAGMQLIDDAPAPLTALLAAFLLPEGCCEISRQTRRLQDCTQCHDRTAEELHAALMTHLRSVTRVCSWSMKPERSSKMTCFCTGLSCACFCSRPPRVSTLCTAPQLNNRGPSMWPAPALSEQHASTRASSHHSASEGAMMACVSLSLAAEERQTACKACASATLAPLSKRLGRTATLAHMLAGGGPTKRWGSMWIRLLASMRAGVRSRHSRLLCRPRHQLPSMPGL